MSAPSLARLQAALDARATKRSRLRASLRHGAHRRREPLRLVLREGVEQQASPASATRILATAIAVGAIRAGHRALVRSVFDLVQDFAEAEATGERRAFVQQLTRVDLLVLEDFGMKKLGPAAAEDLLEVFARRHEAGSTLIATNRPTQDWGVFLGDVPAATAILDRFLAHAETTHLGGRISNVPQWPLFSVR